LHMTKHSDEGEQGDTDEGFWCNCVAGELVRLLEGAKEASRYEHKSEGAEYDEKDVGNVGGDSTLRLDEGHRGA